MLFIKKDVYILKRIACFIFIVIILSITVFSENIMLDKTMEKDLYNYGIMVGDVDGRLRLNDYTTRAEFSKMLCVALGYKDISLSNLSVREDFYDITAEHWAYCYIQIVSAQSLLEGDNGYFNPNENLTLEETIKSIICALGYKPEAEKKGYFEIAEKIGLIELTKVKKDKYVTREECAFLIFKCLDIPLLQLTSFGKNPQYTVMDGNNTPLITLRTKLK